MPSREGHLNPYQQRHLLIACQHLDGLLAGMEEVLRSASSRRAFPKYIADVTAAQRKTIEDHIARIRERLLRVLEAQQLAPPTPEISALHAVRVNLDFLAIDVEELAPRYMRGYGAVSEQAAEELHGIVRQLGAPLRGLQSFLSSICGPPSGGRAASAAAGEEALDAVAEALQSLRRSATPGDHELRSAT